MDSSKIVHLSFQIQLVLVVFTYSLLAWFLFYFNRPLLGLIAVAPVLLLLVLYWKAFWRIEEFAKAETRPEQLFRYGVKGAVAYFLVTAAFAVPIVMASVTAAEIRYPNDPDYTNVLSIVTYITLAALVSVTLLEYHRFRKRKNKQARKNQLKS